MRTPLAAAALCVSLCTGLGHAFQPVTPEQAAWVKAHAIPFSTSQAGHGFDDLAPLKPVIGDARIVSLGEPTHGTREAFQMKHRLLEYLVSELGFSIFSIEANMPEACALTDYIQTGKGDPKELIAGMYFWTWNTEEVLAMVEWMREWNTRHAGDPARKPLQFTGFDMQTPTVAWKQAQDFLALHAPELAKANEGLGEQVLKALRSAGSGRGSSGWTSATGAFPAADAKGKKLRFSCWIRTENVVGWAGAWWRCDTPAGMNGFNNMQDQNITGTTPWTRHEFTIDVPADTENINFGFLLSGEGAAWLDDIEIELDGKPYTNNELFSLDFENDAVRFLNIMSREYEIDRVQTNPHAGKKCFQIKSVPAAEKISAPAICGKADALVKAMTDRRDELVKETSAKEADWAIQNARVVAQCADMAAAENSFTARDQAMAANVRWLLDHNPGQRIVLWAHNGHVAKDEVMGMKSMGSHLKRTYGDSMVVFGFSTGKGRYTAIGGADYKLGHEHELKEAPPGSVESVFAAAGIPRALLDIRKAAAEDPGSGWAASRIPMRSIGALAMDQQFFPIIPNASFDVLVWQEETTASVPIRRSPDPKPADKPKDKPADGR